MAQNVTVAGASYSDVPSVTLPKTGGGTASFTDVTGTTALAADVASGKYFFTASGVLTLGTATGGGGLVYESGTFTPTEDVKEYAITFSGTHSTLPFLAIVMTAVDEYDATLNSAAITWYANWNTLFGSPFYTSTDSAAYGDARYIVRGGNATGSSSGGSSISYPDSSTQASQKSYPRYWVTETGMTARSGTSTAYFRSGTAYRWMAVWAPTTS